MAKPLMIIVTIGEIEATGELGESATVVRRLEHLGIERYARGAIALRMTAGDEAKMAAGHAMAKLGFREPDEVKP